MRSEIALPVVVEQKYFAVFLLWMNGLILQPYIVSFRNRKQSFLSAGRRLLYKDKS